MQDFLIVVDMQNDFITGALGTKEAVAILPKVKEKIDAFKGIVLYTRDTHGQDYMSTQEGANLPVPHCIHGTWGWEIADALSTCKSDGVFDKITFGSMPLARYLQKVYEEEGIGSITLIGLCTDICVISNAMLIKAAMPEVPVIVDASCCAGVTPESHKNALSAMQMCQIKIVENN